MHDLTVPLDPSYPVRIRSGFAEAWTALRQDHGDRRLFVVADARVMRAHPDAVAGLSIEERGKVVQMKGGEQIKSLRTLDRLVAVALERRVDRRCLVVAIGGGTVGDVVGYFAASYMRGLDWCPIATTVIAMADSAIGGKTAVNSHGLKNLIGSFHQPIGVYGALDSLLTLPRRHRTAGLAEVVKCGIIADAELFALLEAKVGDLAPENLALWQELLSRSAAVKADVVSRDPKERGPREILNFGHTLGHALEASHRPRLHHGEAVA